jgi:hypothetical protein
MTLSDLASLGSFVSGLAVLASLVFLFLQMRQMTKQLKQAERNQQALIRQGSRNRIVEITLTRTDPSIADAVRKGFAGDADISATQLEQFTAHMGAILTSLEDVFYQHKEGLLTDSAMETSRSGTRALMGYIGAREVWRERRQMYPAEFAAFVDSHFPASPTPYPASLEQWKLGVGQEKAKLGS